MEGETKINYCLCGVPNHLHGTCCGWINAQQILCPQDALEAYWAIMARDAQGVGTVSLGISYSNTEPLGCTCNRYAQIGQSTLCPVHFPVYGMSYGLNGTTLLINSEP